MRKESTIMTSLAKRAGIIALSATLGMAAFAGTAFAYFTSNTQAAGSYTLDLGYSSEVSEDIVDGNKSISMTNTGNTDIMVRIQLFYGTGVNGNITVTPGADGTDEGWSDNNGVWYWDGVLEPGQSTGILQVDVSAPEGTDLSNFDVTVIGQTSPVYYETNEDGEEVAVPYLWQTAAPGGEVTPTPSPETQE